jgi:hypothetical protein
VRVERAYGLAAVIVASPYARSTRRPRKAQARETDASYMLPEFNVDQQIWLMLRNVRNYAKVNQCICKLFDCKSSVKKEKEREKEDLDRRKWMEERGAS